MYRVGLLRGLGLKGRSSGGKRQVNAEVDGRHEEEQEEAAEQEERLPQDAP